MRACMREWWLRKVVLKSAEDVRVWMCVCVCACARVTTAGGWLLGVLFSLSSLLQAHHTLRDQIAQIGRDVQA
jgi:hypothetical protein